MQTKRTQEIKALVYSAMLAALSVVMARLLSFSVAGGVRWSLDKFPLFLAGMFFGPVMGAITGFVADFTGSLMQFGFNPLLCFPAIFYGLCGGLLRRFLAKNFTVLRLVPSYLLPTAVGAVLVQSFALSYAYPKGSFGASLAYYLSTRSVQFAIVMTLEVLIIYLLMKTNVFTRLGVWPPIKLRKGNEK